MLSWVIIVLILLFFLAESYFLKRLHKQLRLKQGRWSEKNAEVNSRLEVIKREIDELEQKMAEHFFFYDLIRQIAPFLEKKHLFKAFCEEIKYLGTVEDAQFLEPRENSSYLQFKAGDDQQESIYIKTTSKKIIEHKPFLEKLLKLCLERINLYEKFQQLSIYDTLTEIYNRRYFMDRYLQEFNRSKDFSLNMSFLIIDIDNFKNINDTYGHLVGDAVLREIAKFIKENIREIDFAARLGGEEFSVILLETDRTAAIAVAERICSRISQAKLKVFDETLNITVSIGLATFPQNTLHDDVLVEIADKALYKAKISGKNRVCWF